MANNYQMCPCSVCWVGTQYWLHVCICIEMKWKQHSAIYYTKSVAVLTSLRQPVVWKYDLCLLRKVDITLSTVNWKCMVSWYLTFFRSSSYINTFFAQGKSYLEYSLHLFGQKMKQILLTLLKCSFSQTG